MGMGSEIFIAGSGCLNRARELEVTANNMANGDTIGFKRDIPSFSSIFYPWVIPPSPSQGLSFPIIEGAKTDFSQGMMKETGNSFDFALEGDGFFVVSTPSGVRYTRNGSFRANAKKELETKEGYQVMGSNGPIKGVGARIEGDSKGNLLSDGKQIGKLRVVEFKELSMLIKTGDSLYKTAGDDVPALAAKKTTVHQEKLEMSNVNIIAEMTGMIETMREYESEMKAIQTLDELSRKTVNEIARV
jgi:flagellar basal-body rod protein FlgG